MWVGAASAAIPDSVKRALAARNYSVAVEWLSGHVDEAEAAYELAKLYRLGKGVPEDEERAVVLFESAALAGHVEAQYLLGKHFERKALWADANRWMRAAADAGHSRAAAWLEKTPQAAALTDPIVAIRRGAPPPAVADEAFLAARDDAGRTALMIAAEVGDSDWLDFLIGHEPDLDARDEFGATALHMAVASERAAAVSRLLRAGANPNVAAEDGSTPLHLAVAAGDVGLAGELLDAGADASRANRAGWSPSMVASRSDDRALRNLFGIRDGGSAGSGTPRTMLEAARRGDVDGMTRAMADGGRLNGADESVIALTHLAAKRGDATVLELLIDAGADVEGVDGQGNTPLATAASEDCEACLETLLARGADLERAGPEGLTALIAAARNGHLVIARRLLAAGADPDRRDGRGRDALWWACQAGRTDLALMLLGLSVPLQTDEELIGPLHLAAANDDVALVTRLLTVAEIDARSASGNTALMLAAHAGATDAADRLIEAGASLEATNGSGDTAVILAARAGRLSTTELLLRAGANPRTRNDQFQSAVTIMEARDEPEWRTLVQRVDKGLLGVLGAI